MKGKLKIHIPQKPKNITRKRVKTENIPDKKQEIQQAIHERAEYIKSDNVEDYWQNMKKTNPRYTRKHNWHENHW